MLTDCTVLAERWPSGPFRVREIPVLDLMSTVISLRKSLDYRTRIRASSGLLTVYVEPWLCTENALYKDPMAFRKREHCLTAVQTIKEFACASQT